MSTLSVIMIVRNESACLGGCLASVAGIADEIVVLDTGSTDATPAVARGFGARLLSIEWRDDFAWARNASIAAATGDWLLHMDADEALDPAGARRVREIVDADGFGADAVEVTLANYCDDPRAWRWVPCRPDDPMARGRAGYIEVGLLRLFRNGRGFEYREPVHENITESVLEKGGVIRREPVVIHHYGYALDGPRAREKALRYLQIARRKTELRPRDPKTWHDYAEQCLACGDAAAAEAACRKALEFDPNHLGAGTTLANLLLNRGAFDEARGLLETFERAGAAPPHVIIALGAIACRQGRLEEARSRLETVAAAAPGAIMAHFYLARTLDRLGDAEGARRALESAHEAAPTLEEVEQRLRAHGLRVEGERLFAEHGAEQALPRFVDAVGLDPDDPLAHNDLGVALHALGDIPRARMSFERALLLAPDMPEARENLEALGPAPPEA